MGHKAAKSVKGAFSPQAISTPNQRRAGNVAMACWSVGGSHWAMRLMAQKRCGVVMARNVSGESTYPQSFWQW